MRFWQRRLVAPGLVVPTSVDRAAGLVARLDARLCVSIADPDRRASADRHLEGVHCKILRLDIDDIERPAPGCVMPAPAHLLGVLEATRLLRPSDTVVVHCQAGVSRSAAVALCAAADRWLKAGFAPADAVGGAFEQVIRVAPHIRPNIALMEMGASILGVEPSDWRARTWSLHR